jgi:hypothetical protein
MHDTSASHFNGEIPDLYDRGLGPVIFAEYATDIAARAAASNPLRVLETAAGTGIDTRRLRDTLPAGAHLTATDLNVDMLNRHLDRPSKRYDRQTGSLPCRNAATHVGGVLLACSQAPFRGRVRPLPTAAVENDSPGNVIWKRGCIKSRERIQQRSGNPFGRIFGWFAHVNQENFAGMQQLRDFGRLESLNW